MGGVLGSSRDFWGGLWEEIQKELALVSDNWKFKIENGSRVRFWLGHCCDTPIRCCLS